MVKNKEIIAVFCGSFNPPLYSHFSLAEQLLNNDISKIIFVPVSSKYNKNGLISDIHRYNMLKLVCDENPSFEVSDIEFNMQKQPYTLETLLKIQELHPNCEIRLIIGSDNLKNLDTWYEPQSLLTKFKIIVLSRDEDNIEKIISENELLKKHMVNILEYKLNLRTNLSSTYVRNLIKNGKQIKYLLPDKIITYIQDNNLYV